ncbi:MAG: hypothetical protein JWP31_2620 [Aeromicrobium sp.]|nr:hypothetical protein [Aeromicrobium sp.]
MTWDVPADWTWRPLRAALTSVTDQVRPAEFDDDWLYVGLEHVQAATGELRGVRLGSAGIRSNKFRFDAGDVLYGKLRPNLRKCAVAESPGVCSTDLLPLRPVDADAAHFLAMQLRSEPFTASVMRLVGGASLPRVTATDLFTLNLPAPPPGDAGRLHELARSMSRLRQRQRDLDGAVTAAVASATAAVIGLAPGLVEVSLTSTPDS